MANVRQFEKHIPIVCYDKSNAAIVSIESYKIKRQECISGVCIDTFIIRKKSAKAWTMKKGDLCRITVCEASQVGDLNFWNIENPKEHLYSGKTRQLHSSHLKEYDHLWSNLPYLRSMATFVYDSLRDYGVDEDGASVHDVIGTRCDNYTYKLITGKETIDSCHNYLTSAIREFGLSESDVHDVWNIFMCTGFHKTTQQYFCKPSPSKKGDFIEFIADMDLIVALSCCPHGT
jgi:uncharacterized protein YcgI (DUF1989 family)